MNNIRLCLVVAVGSLVLTLAPSVFAGKGGGGKGGGGGAGGAGSTSTLPVVITFRDCTGSFASAAYANLHPEAACPVAEDRVKSDTGFAYEDGLDSVEAFIALSGSYGALGVRLAKSPRGIFLDFSDCASAPGNCDPPFTSQVDSSTAIDVDANKVKQNGLLGMAVGETISTPLLITYGDFGFVNFNPGLNGKNPCKGKSNYVTATRTSDTTWEIVSDPNTIGCVTLPGGGFGGTYRMPFQFTVEQK